ncbi:MAG: ribose-phosphate diphosphokinase [Halobacteriales archaeon]|nr:ribose-phosphate diphosphokinase [Halobacteriales archaeon]
MIVSGSAVQSLAAELAAETGRPLATVEAERFPDGELLAAVPDFDADEAVVVASTATDAAHLELLQLQDAVREAGAGHVTTVLGYMGYARQDQSFGPGHPVSARAMARSIGTGADRVLVVNPHAPGVVDYFEPPAEALDAAGVLAEPLPAGLADPLFLAPDASARGIASTVRDAYGDGAVDHFEKTRVSSQAVEIAPSDATVEGRDVVVVDDIIATGTTMSEAIGVLAERGVGRVFVGCVHPVLAANARTRLAQAGVEAVYGTDTLDRTASAVSVAPVVADAL